MKHQIMPSVVSRFAIFNGALIRLIALVSSKMVVSVSDRTESFIAEDTVEWLFTSMDAHVHDHVRGIDRVITTFIFRLWLFECASEYPVLVILSLLILWQPRKGPECRACIETI